MSEVTLRIGGEKDEVALRRLAARDAALPLAGTVLIAEVGGEPRAAIALETRRVIADPFAPTAGLVELLRARAKQIARSGRPPFRRGHPMRRRLWGWLPRPARETTP